MLSLWDTDMLTHDNDGRFKPLWKELWKGAHFYVRYNLHSDPAERANRQVLEVLRSAVS